jgi:hypothetical protein
VEPAVPPPAYDEALDAATAAALAEEEDEALEDDEDDFGIELPALGEGEMIDMVALAALPQSMQLEFMQRYRVQQVTANRERFAKASETAPAAFSAAQMEAYIAGGRIKRQLNALVRQGDQPDAMRAQRIAGDTVRCCSAALRSPAAHTFATADARVCVRQAPGLRAAHARAPAAGTAARAGC